MKLLSLKPLLSIAMGTGLLLCSCILKAKEIDTPLGSQSDATTAQASARGCYVFEHANYKGAAAWVNNGYYYSNVGSFWNDKISSVACTSQCVLRSWEHIKFTGAYTYFYTTPYVGNAWNDRISSLGAYCW